MTDQPTLHQAAQATIDAIATRKMPAIQSAGAILADALARDRARYAVGVNQGRPQTITDQQIHDTRDLSADDAARQLGVSPSTIRKRRRK